MMARLSVLHWELLRLTANDELCRRFISLPGVGPVTARAFKTAIDDRATSALTSVSRCDNINLERPTSGASSYPGCVHKDGVVHRSACNADPIVPMEIDQSLGRAERYFT